MGFTTRVYEIIKGPFFRDLAKLAGCAGVSHSIVLIASPLLTRLYDPKEFGTFTLYTSILSIALVGTTLRFEQAIALPKSIVSAATILILCFTLLFGGAILLYFPIFLFHRSVILPEIQSFFIWLLPLSVLAAGANIILISFSIRQQAFDAIAKTRLVQAGSTVIFQISSGAAGFGPLGLVLGDLGGRVIALSPISKPALTVLNRLSYWPKWKHLAWSFVRHKQFALFSAPAGLINTSTTYALPIFIAFAFSHQETGWFGLSQRVMAIPAALIGTSALQVFLSRFTKALRERADTILQLFDATALFLALIGLGPLLLAIFLLPSYIPVIFGEAWAEAGHIIRILAPMYWFQFFAAPISGVLNALQRQRIQLAWDVIRSLSLLILLLVANFHNWTFVSILSGYVSLMSGFYILLVFLCRRAVRAHLLR